MGLRRGRKFSRHTLPQRIERTADLYLEECYARGTAARVSELARQVARTREHLTRTASMTLGMPLRDLLRARQLRRAEKLLRTTSLSTVQIGIRAAFGTHKTFYRVFRGVFGMTPGQYRKKITE
jgi:AraC family transcriptional regulator